MYGIACLAKTWKTSIHIIQTYEYHPIVAFDDTIGAKAGPVICTILSIFRNEGGGVLSDLIVPGNCQNRLK